MTERGAQSHDGMRHLNIPGSFIRNKIITIEEQTLGTVLHFQEENESSSQVWELLDV